MFEKQNKFTVFLKKFNYAFKGLYLSLKEEKSLLVDLIVGIIVLIIAWIINDYMSISDWIVIVIIIFLVIGIELINTAIENLTDLIAFKYNFNARKIKDIAAASSLVFSLMAIIVGLLIFIPKFITIFSQLTQTNAG